MFVAVHMKELFLEVLKCIYPSNRVQDVDAKPFQEVQSDN